MTGKAKAVLGSMFVIGLAFAIFSVTNNAGFLGPTNGFPVYLPRPSRSVSNYRLYPKDTVRRVRFVGHMGEVP